MLKMGLQVAVAIGVPLLIGAFGGDAFDQRSGTRPYGLVIGLVLGIVVGALGLVGLLRRYLSVPLPPPTEAAREAGRRWEREIEEEERRREEERTR